MTDTDWFFRTDVGQVWLDLPMSYARKRTTDAIMDDLRRRLLRIPGPTSIELAKINTGPPMGKAVEVKVKGKYLETLREAADLVRKRLSGIKGVIDIGDDFKAGKEEVRFKVNAEKAALYGLTVGQVGLALRTALEGDKAGRLFDADEEIDIVVKLDKRYLKKPADLLRLPLLLRSGKTILLGDVASYSTKPSIAEIRRYRNQRAITVYAGVDASKATSVEVNAELHRRIADLPDRFPGVTLDYTGEWQEFKESFSALGKLFVLGVLLIYVILGAQFRSYIQPVVILFTVPFSFIGAMVGLAISGNPFSIITLFGMVALAGVAVNDAIVLISFANRAKAEGIEPEEAIIQAGCLRLRPIILTSLTTIAGLLPMAMGLGGTSLTWSPLANTIVWGLAVGTLLTLFLIPAVYLLLVHDLRGGLGRLFQSK
jgi:multidrug efflux pump subunit AcrB